MKQFRFQTQAERNAANKQEIKHIIEDDYQTLTNYQATHESDNDLDDLVFSIDNLT